MRRADNGRASAGDEQLGVRPIRVSEGDVLRDLGSEQQGLHPHVHVHLAGWPRFIGPLFNSVLPSPMTLKVIRRLVLARRVVHAHNAENLSDPPLSSSRTRLSA